MTGRVDLEVVLGPWRAASAGLVAASRRLGVHSAAATWVTIVGGCGADVVYTLAGGPHPDVVGPAPVAVWMAATGVAHTADRLAARRARRAARRVRRVRAAAPRAAGVDAAPAGGWICAPGDWDTPEGSGPVEVDGGAAGGAL